MEKSTKKHIHKIYLGQNKITTLADGTKRHTAKCICGAKRITDITPDNLEIRGAWIGGHLDYIDRKKAKGPAKRSQEQIAAGRRNIAKARKPRVEADEKLIAEGVVIINGFPVTRFLYRRITPGNARYWSLREIGPHGKIREISHTKLKPTLEGEKAFHSKSSQGEFFETEFN